MIEYRTQYIYRRTRAQGERDTQIALCTCPWCHLVWEHTENPGRASYDLQRTRERFGGSHDIWTCSRCGERSVAHMLPEKGRVKWTREDDVRHEVLPAKSR